MTVEIRNFGAVESRRVSATVKNSSSLKNYLMTVWGPETGAFFVAI